MSLYTETDMSRYGKNFDLDDTPESTLYEQFFEGMTTVVAEEVPSVASEFFKQVGVVQEASDQVVVTGQLIETYGVPEDAVGVDTLSPALYLRWIEQQKTVELLQEQMQAEEAAGETTAELRAKMEEIQVEIRAITEQIKTLLAEIQAEKINRADLTKRETETRQVDNPGRLDGITLRTESIAFKEEQVESLRRLRKQLRKTLATLGDTYDQVEDASVVVSLVDRLTIERGAVTIKR